MIDVELKLDLSKSQAYYKEARRYSPGGAPDAKGWDGDLFYIDRAQGNRLWDLDGNEFIDYPCRRRSHYLGAFRTGIGQCSHRHYQEPRGAVRPAPIR